LKPLIFSSSLSFSTYFCPKTVSPGKYARRVVEFNLIG